MTSSPGRSAVDIGECIEEVVKLSLALYVEEQVVDSSSFSRIAFPKDYCLQLVQNDLSNPLPTHSTSPLGVPPYPLYKRLAESLLHSIHSGTILTTHQKAILGNEDVSPDQSEDKWNHLLFKEGSKLLEVLKSVDYELHVQEPFFTQLRDGQKTIEGRCAVGDYNKIGAGAIILFNKSLVLQVQEVHRHATFAEMLEAESLLKVLPGINTIEEGVQVYRNFYSEEKEKANGVLAIYVGKPYSQLHTVMSSILLGLGYEGVQRLLGLGHTVDIHKNQLATAVVSRLITQCCWLNMHIVPPHGLVFEVRVADGYGARWSGDGTKFIGFLEPYMMDGHSRGWKH